MRNIIITGGELFNKGAEAMTFITVDELKKRFPNHKIYLLSDMDLKRPKEERDRYAFSFLGWNHIKFAKCQKNFILRLLCKIKNGHELKEVEQIYKNTDLMIDISGYALADIWSFNHCNLYLEHLEYAKAFEIPVYLLPQSFGPFDFKGKSGQIIDEKIRELLPTAKIIYAREKEGYDALKKYYGLANVQISEDIVLQSKGYNINNIFAYPQTFEMPLTDELSVGLIPNSKNQEMSKHNNLDELYKVLIDYELKRGHKVVLLSHSSQDIKLCKKLKESYKTDSRVILFEKEFGSIEFNEIVKHFKYVIASRFHSVVHAYKNNTPCIVLGWATKYHDLTKIFEQEKYMVDVREILDANKIVLKLEYLNENLNKEKEIISERLLQIQETNVFDALILKSEE